MLLRHDMVWHATSLKFGIRARERENREKACRHSRFFGRRIKILLHRWAWKRGWGRRPCFRARARARLFSRGNREKNFPEISDAEEGVGKHRRDIPGKMIIRSWKNFGTLEEWEGGGEERWEECGVHEAAVSRDVTLRRSFVVLTVFMGDCSCSARSLVKSRLVYISKHGTILVLIKHCKALIYLRV